MSSNLKDVSRYVLPSGLTIIIETLPYVRSVALSYYLRSGSVVESEEHSGASHFLEHLVVKHDLLPFSRIFWNSRAACALQNLKRVLDMTLAEMRLIKSGGATDEELSSAKLHLKGSILLSLESTVSRMSGLARQEYYFGRQFSPDEIIAAIDAVTLEDIAHVAATIVDSESLSLTLIGNLKSPGISTGMLRQAVA